MPERLFGNNKKEATVSSKVEGENVECRPYCMAMVMVFPFLLFHAVARNACCKQEEIEGQLCIYLNAHTHSGIFMAYEFSSSVHTRVQKYSRYSYFHKYETSSLFMLYITYSFLLIYSCQNHIKYSEWYICYIFQNVLKYYSYRSL